MRCPLSGSRADHAVTGIGHRAVSGLAREWPLWGWQADCFNVRLGSIHGIRTLQFFRFSIRVPSRSNSSLRGGFDRLLIFRRHERDQDPLGPSPRSSAPSCSPSSGGRPNGSAWRLAFQPQLGHPWFELLGWPVYQPPAFFWWWFAYDAYARRDLRRGRLHRRVRRDRRRRRRDRHVGVACAGDQEGHDLRLGAVGGDRARSARPACSAMTACCSAAGATNTFATTAPSMCCVSPRPDPAKASASWCRRC